MTDAWTERWNQRYADDGFAYGEQPNNYLKQQLERLKTAKVLFPAEGEGRNKRGFCRQTWLDSKCI